MKRNGSPRARFKADDLRLWFLVDLPIHKAFAEEAARKAEVPGAKLALSRHQVAVPRQCLAETAIGVLIQIAERSDRTKYRQQMLNPLLEAGRIEMTIPDKPRGSLQRHRTTTAGQAAIKSRKTKS